MFSLVTVFRKSNGLSLSSFIKCSPVCYKFSETQLKIGTVTRFWLSGDVNCNSVPARLFSLKRHFPQNVTSLSSCKIKDQYQNVSKFMRKKYTYMSSAILVPSLLHLWYSFRLSSGFEGGV